MLDLTIPFGLYARLRHRHLRHEDAVSSQQQQLRRLIARAQNTRFGRDHGFSSIASVSDFQQQVPLRHYEDFWRDYWQAAFPRLQDISWPGLMPYLAQTSGTTSGVTKYIPVSQAMLVSNRRAALDIVTHHFANRPHSRMFEGLSFMLGGSTSLNELSPGVSSGDLSGIAGRTVPWWARLRYFPPRELETIADWEEKIARLAPASLKADIRSFGGVPSWLLLFLDKVAELRPESGGRLAGIYPKLEMLVHGGVNFTPYRPLFARRLEGSRAETREIYPASEGFIAVADRGDGDGLRLVTDTGIFYEFVPVEELGSETPTRHWVDTVALDVNYAIVLSTCAGLWSYVVGDTVRFVDRAPPRLLVTGRTSYALSAFGEHLIGEEIERAVAAAASNAGLVVTDYAVGAIFPDQPGAIGGHIFIVEFADGLPDSAAVAHVAAAIDYELAQLNVDYRDHRARGYAMRAPVVHPVPPGTFAAWMRSRGRLGGQNKVPRVINDPELFAGLRAFTGCG
jgi:hypothetical protein